MTQQAVQRKSGAMLQGKLIRRLHPKPGYFLVVHPTQSSCFEQKLVLITETSLSGGSQGLCINNHEDFGNRLHRETAGAVLRFEDLSEAESTSGDSAADRGLLLDGAEAIGVYCIEEISDDGDTDNEVSILSAISILYALSALIAHGTTKVALNTFSTQ